MVRGANKPASRLSSRASCLAAALRRGRPCTASVEQGGRSHWWIVSARCCAQRTAQLFLRRPTQTAKD
eukprot:3044663-Pyramimonas_sp.AAC.1